jgi:hypothetical protein
MKSNCSIQTCEKPIYAFGLCSAHYTRQRRHGDPLAGRTPPGEPLEWLCRHVTHTGSDCLKWPYATARGYGIVSIDGVQRVASNLMCELVHGPSPSAAHETAHSCGNGHLGCVNPTHLRWATRIENRHDMIEHGSRSVGEKNGSAKLSEDDVRQVRALKRQGVHIDQIASRFHISRAQAYLIVNRSRWKHVA